MTAIREGTVSQAQQLLAKYPDLLAEHGPSMLEHAAESNRADMLPILVAAGINVNSVSLSNTPLGSAAHEGAFEAALWLLDHGADINGRASPKDATPLHNAIREGRLDMVKFLLERGADPNLTNGNPAKNAVAAARFWQHEEIAAYLESQGLSEVVIEPEPVNVEMPSFQAKDTLVPAEWFDKKWWHVYDFGTRHGLEAMCEKNQVLFLVGYLIDQLCSGGALMFYCNPSAECTAKIAVALDKIGATRAAQVIRDINGLFPGGGPAVDHDTRERQVKKLPEKASRLGAELEQIFDQWLPNGGERVLLSQLYDYYHAEPGAAADGGGMSAFPGS